MTNPNFNILSDNFLDKQNLISVLNFIFIYGIAVGACIIKIPQLLKIYITKNVKGLSFLSMYLEILVGSALIIFSYMEHINIKLWVDVVFINIQNIMILLLMWAYSKQVPKYIQILKVSFYILFNAYLIYWAPPKVIPLLGLISVPMSCFSKIPQIYLNFTNKHTGNLSLITYFLTFGGNLARIFTVVFSTTNKIYLANCVFIAILNLTSLCQILYYWKNTKKVMDEAKTKKE